MARLTWIAASAIFLIGGSVPLSAPLLAGPGPGSGPEDQTPPKSDTLQEESRLALVRYVDGEFAKVVMPLPAGKSGFHLKAGAPLDEHALHMTLQGHDAAANPGDKVQITRLQFREKQIRRRPGPIPARLPFRTRPVPLSTSISISRFRI
jgi:hypothetical protein